MEHCNGNDIVYEKAAGMTRKAGLEHLEMPRRCGQKTQWNKGPADRTCQYFERLIFYTCRRFYQPAWYEVQHNDKKS